MSESSSRVVVVTGGGQGLGRATAIAFSAAGYDVAVIGRTASKLEETVAVLGGRGLSVIADVTQPDQVRRAFSEIVAAFGGVDVLINNAASYSPFRFETAADDDIGRMISQSLVAPMYCIREALPLMRRRGAGDIVNISSQSADTPQPFMIVYGAAKAAIEALGRGLRNELRGEPYRIVTFQVGVIANSTVDPNWLRQKEDYLAALERSGIGPLFTFPGASPESLAASIVHVVSAPRDIYLETVVARGTGISP
jgi:NAD(P)-dependent dehydrogenase (short-subunit alcohol dehydrogenase family)